MAQNQPSRESDQFGDMPRTDQIRGRGDARKADESNVQRGEYVGQGYGTRTTDTGPAATLAYGYYGSTGTAGYGIPGGTVGYGGNTTGTYGTTGDNAGAGYGAGTGTGGTAAGYGYGTGGGNTNTGYGSNLGSETTTRRGDRNKDRDI